MSKTNFVDGDPSRGILGTIVTADFLNALNKHYHTGMDQDGHGALPYAADTGTANAYVVTLNPALTQYVIGMPIYFKPVNDNTGVSTVNVNSLGAKTIKKNLVEDLTLGDIRTGDVISVVYDGSNFQLIQAPQRDKLVGSDIIQDFVVSGLLGTDPGATLTMTIPGGIAYVMGRRVVKLTGASDLTRTYTTSKDTYVDLSHVGAVTYTEVNNGAVVPSVAANSLRLMKVVTNATEITVVVDLRVLTPGVRDSIGLIRAVSSYALANTVPVRDSTGDIARTDGSSLIHTKIVNIGDWNMDTTSFVTIDIGINILKIRDISIMIRRDGDSYFSDLIVAPTGIVTGYWYMVNGTPTTVVLNRVAATMYDSVNYASTSFNRGWITVTYVE